MFAGSGGNRDGDCCVVVVVVVETVEGKRWRTDAPFCCCVSVSLCTGLLDLWLSVRSLVPRVLQMPRMLDCLLVLACLLAHARGRMMKREHAFWSLQRDVSKYSGIQV